MATLEDKINKKSTESVEKLRKQNRKIASTIFNNMFKKATKLRYSMSIEDNRIKSILLPIADIKIDAETSKFGANVQPIIRKEWFTPYIYNNKLYFKNSTGIMPGSLIFGKSVNRVS